MEHCIGGDLSTYIQKKGPLGEKRSKQILTEIGNFLIKNGDLTAKIVKALYYLQEQFNIIHRDLKPQNILMTTEDGVKLMNQYIDNFVVRIGAYLGEVVRSSMYDNDFQWYEFNSVNSYSSKLNESDRHPETDTVLYSKKRDIVLFPITDAELFLEGKSPYPTLLNYVEETIKLNT